MNPQRVLCTVAVLMFLVVLSGCPRPASTAPAGAAPIAVQILAYINVSSGCQQATVDFLQALPAKQPGVQVELVDFGDGDKGAARWEQSGLKCMAIEINGHSIVKYPVNGTPKVMAFRAPAGLYWTHEDLVAAVAAAAQGTLKPATEDEFLQEGGSEPTPAELEKYKSERKAPASK